MPQPIFAFCPACGAKLPEQAKFCPGCGIFLSEYVGDGTSTSRRTPAPAFNWTAKHYAILAGLTLVIWLPAWEFQAWSGGKRPTQPFSEALGPTSDPKGPPPAEGHDAATNSDPEIAKLEAAAKAAPDDLDAQHALAAKLVNKLRQSDTPTNELILSTVDALDGVLRVNPKDSDALMAMGDITFNQQVFGKAVDFYSRYLALQPKDDDARARYGSALTFAGKFSEAIAELNKVVANDPKNFHGAAYLSITYAQMGNQAAALSAGEKALALAPNEEARARFSEFLTDVKNPKPKRDNTAGNTPGSPDTAKTSKPASAAVSSGAQSLAEVIRANPIAGPKFVDAHDLGSGEVGLYFSAFPMDKMPPFVRDKFVNELKIKAKELGVKTLVFLDKDSGSEMLQSAVE